MFYPGNRLSIVSIARSMVESAGIAYWVMNVSWNMANQAIRNRIRTSGL